MGTKGGDLEQALRAGRSRDYATAVRILEELVSRSEAPAPEALLLLGRAYHALGEYPRAIIAFRDHLKAVPSSAAGYFFAGRTYLALRLPSRSVPLFRKALRLKNRDPQILALLGVSYLRMHRSREAVDYLQRAVGEAPENRRVYRAYLNALLVRGIRLCRSGDAPLGAQMLRFVLDNGIDEPLPRLELGRVYRDEGRLEEALEQYEAAIALAPEDPSIRWYRASILMALDRDEQARRELGRIRALQQDTPDLSWNADLVDRFMARSFLVRRQWRRAMDACRALLRRGQEDAGIHAMFAEASRNLKEYNAARNHLDRAVATDPEKVELRYAQLMLAWESEDWKGMKRALDAASRLGGETAELVRFRALLSSRTEEDDKRALSQLQDALRRSGPAPELMYALAERYLKLGLADLAEPWFARTREVVQNHEQAYLGEIAALETLTVEGDVNAPSRLATAYGRYLARYGDNAAIRRDRALFLVRRGEFSAAAEDLQALLAWEPANATLRRVLAYAYRKTGRYREASVLLKSLLREKPRDLPLLLEFSGCLERAGAGGYAAAVLEKALPLFPSTPEPALSLGILLYRRKRTEAALDALREAMARSPDDPRPYRRMATIYRKTGVSELAERYEREAERREKA